MTWLFFLIPIKTQEGLSLVFSVHIIHRLFCCITLVHVCLNNTQDISTPPPPQPHRGPHGLQTKSKSRQQHCQPPPSAPSSWLAYELATCVCIHTPNKCVYMQLLWLCVADMNYRHVLWYTYVWACVLYICCVWHQMTESVPAGPIRWKGSEGSNKNTYSLRADAVWAMWEEAITITGIFFSCHVWLLSRCKKKNTSYFYFYLTVVTVQSIYIL